jgi:hypothetical protein
VIGLTSQRDAYSRASSDWLTSLRTLPEARSAPRRARPTHHLILYVPGARARYLGHTDPCPTVRMLITPHEIRRGG